MAEAVLPLTPSFPGSIYMPGFGGLFAENTFSLQVLYVMSKHIRHFGEINISAVVNILGNQWGM